MKLLFMSSTMTFNNCRKLSSDRSGGHCLALNSISSFSDYNDMEELDYTSDPKYISTEGCFACKMNGDSGPQSHSRSNRRRGHRKGRRSKWTRTYTYAQRNRRHHHGQQRSRRDTNPVERVNIYLTFNNTRPSRPILFLQPSLAESLVNHTVEYIVEGKDSNQFEIKSFGMESSSNDPDVQQSGLWALHYKHQVPPTSSVVKHHLRIIGRRRLQNQTYYVYEALQRPNSSLLELDVKLRIIIS